MTENSLDLTLNSTDDPIPDLDATALSGRRSQRDKMIPRYNQSPLVYPSNLYELSYVTRAMYVPYMFIFRMLIIFSHFSSLILPAQLSQPIADFIDQTRAEDEMLEEIPILQKKMKDDLKEVNDEQQKIKEKVNDLKRRLQRMEERRGNWRLQAEKYKADKAARDAKEQEEKIQAEIKNKTEKVEITKKNE